MGGFPGPTSHNVVLAGPAATSFASLRGLGTKAFVVDPRLPCRDGSVSRVAGTGRRRKRVPETHEGPCSVKLFETKFLTTRKMPVTPRVTLKEDRMDVTALGGSEWPSGVRSETPGGVR